jgi:transketolase
MRDAFIARLTEIAERDPRIMLITGDLGFGVLNDYSQRLPKQFLNAGVAEQNMTQLATGLALEGHIVFTYSIGNFPTLRCLEQIRNDAGYHKANVNVVCVGGGFSYGSLGMSHHATEDLAILRAIPTMTCVAPGDDFESKEATSALVAKSGPGYLRLDRVSNVIEGCDAPFEMGKARTVREGVDFTIIACGSIVQSALQAATSLAQRGVDVRVLSMHTVKPIDTEAIRRAATETGGILTLEEHNLDGGLGGAVAEVCMDQGLQPRAFARMGLGNQFSSIVGSQDYLRSRYQLDAPAVVARILSLVGSPTLR